MQKKISAKIDCFGGRVVKHENREKIKCQKNDCFDSQMKNRKN